MTTAAPPARPLAVATMRAAVMTAPGTLCLQDVDVPAPGAGEVRIRLEGSGVCASSLPLWEGREWFRYPQAPGVPGHEGWGRVDALGSEASGVAVGDRVAVLSYRAFAEYDLAPVDAVVPLPAPLAGSPFPGEAIGCAMNVFARSAVLPGQTVAILGVGFLGALLTRLCATAGARVIAISRRPFSLEVARQYGAHETLPMDDHSRIVDRVTALTGGELCDRVIECVGAQWPLDLAGELTRERGRLVVAGFHQDGPRQVNMFLWNWRGLDVVNAHERDRAAYVAGIQAAVEAVSTGALDVSPLLTHRLALDEAGTALDLCRRRPDGFVKAVVAP